jgi:hypothetical protein
VRRKRGEGSCAERYATVSEETTVPVSSNGLTKSCQTYLTPIG